MVNERRWRSGGTALLCAMALGLTACGADEGGSAGDVEFDAGVTEEPCPGSENTDRGCIYLGTLSDLTEGPFAPLGVEIVEGQKAFWDRVNADGGIGGEFDVNVEEYVRDNRYNPEEHVARLREIEPDIAALTQSLGTPMTIAALDIQDQNDIVGAPATWWSGWAFEDEGLVLESGYSYCMEAVNGLDYAAEEYGEVEQILAIGYPGDYGGDNAAGAELWAEANGGEVETVETAPNAQAGNQDSAVQAISRQDPDVVLLATGPAEMAEIVGKAVAGGYEGRFVGAVPTFNPAVLDSEAGPAIRERYVFMSPWAPFGSDTPAHAAMEEAAGEDLPANDGYTFGWIWAYPVKAALEQAAENGDMTREGIRAAAEEATVDYEGALPDREYGGEANDTIVREAIVARADDEAPLGASVERDFFTGPTAEELQLDEPCSSAG